ncbi:MAG: HAMP domain-containing sensor histidine kinase [Pseudobdellovibrio sp.]
MTLKEWFQKYQSRPLKIAAVFLLAVWSVFAVRSYLTIETKQQTYVKQTADLLSISDQQKNRVLAESLLEILISQGGAAAAELCKGDQQVIGANQDLLGCKAKGSFYEKVIEARVPGSASLVLYARFNLISAFSPLVSSLVFALVLVFLGFYFIQTAQDRIKKDLFEPIAGKLLGQEDLEIKELADLRSRIHEAKELESHKAVTLAIQENNQQVAHDIRSPIDAINALLKMVNIPGSELKSALDKAVKRANSVANYLLHTEKKASDENTGYVFNITSVVNDIAIEKRALFANGVIEVVAPRNLFFKCKLSSESLSRILSNIVDNGILACDKNRKIKINVNHDENFIDLEVVDSGRGILPESLKRLGEKGFTQRSEKDFSGTGRGVYSAKKTLKEVGGEIIFTSEVGFGTSVKIRIPVEINKIATDVDLVLIDDEEIHRTVWALWAQTENKKIMTFATSDDFLVNSRAIPKATVIFLDSDFGKGIKGQDYISVIKEMGFKKVVLATGHAGSKSMNLIGADGVIGKNPHEALKFMQTENLDFKAHMIDLT